METNLSDLPVNLNNLNQIEFIAQDQDTPEDDDSGQAQDQEQIQILRKGRIVDGKFAQRNRARELAVQFLYSLDNYAQEFETALEYFLGEGGKAERELQVVKDYCQYLTRGVLTRQSEIDDILLRVVTGWRPERMVSVDRVVLRLMIFEGFLARRLPINTAIAEAVQLAKTFGTDDSPHFVNGVMAKVVPYLFPDYKINKRKPHERKRSQQNNSDKSKRDNAKGNDKNDA